MLHPVIAINVKFSIVLVYMINVIGIISHCSSLISKILLSTTLVIISIACITICANVRCSNIILVTNRYSNFRRLKTQCREMPYIVVPSPLSWPTSQLVFIAFCYFFKIHTGSKISNFAFCLSRNAAYFLMTLGCCRCTLDPIFLSQHLSFVSITLCSSSTAFTRKVMIVLRSPLLACIKCVTKRASENTIEGSRILVHLSTKITCKFPDNRTKE